MSCLPKYGTVLFGMHTSSSETVEEYQTTCQSSSFALQTPSKERDDGKGYTLIGSS